MLYESFSLVRSKGADHRWADESGEEIGGTPKVLAVLASLAIAGSTVLLPFALLYLP